MKLRMRLMASMVAVIMAVSSMGFTALGLQTKAAPQETENLIVLEDQAEMMPDEENNIFDMETNESKIESDSEDKPKNNEPQTDVDSAKETRPQADEQNTEETEREILKGEVNRITWQIDENGNLTIEGEGNLLDKADTSYETPWYPYRDQITSAKITVKNMTNTYRLFRGCENMVSVDVSDFDTSQVTNMGYMFENCKSLTTLDVSHFDTSNVTYMYSMFSNCENLEELDVCGFDTSQVTYMGNMFSGCRKLKKLDVSKFNTGKVTAMFSMFSYCIALEELDVSHFDTSHVTIFDNMFSNCEKLTLLDVSGFDTSQATNLNAMFSSCKSLTDLDVSNFDTSHAVYTSHMFSYCPNLTKIDVSHFDTSRVTQMYSMFAECSSLTNLDLSNFDTRRVTDMHGMFSGCTNLTALDVSSFDTSRVTMMYHMFENCKSLVKLDISSFDTHQVTDMYTMFSGCSSLTELNLKHFNTDQVTDMRQMFSGCTNLAKLDISNFNTSQVTSMYTMFLGCSSLTELDLKHFNTSQVIGMGWMFSECSSLTKLNVSSFDTSHVKQMDEIFKECASLTELDLHSFDLSQVDRPGAIFYGCTNLTRIYSPVHLASIISLPKTNEDIWYQEYSEEPVTNLPQNLAYSVLLEKNEKSTVTYPSLKARKAKIYYECGETLNVDDLTVTYYEEEQATLIDNYTTNAGEIEMSVPGLKELIITYNGQSASINIIVSAKQEYEPPKDIYIVEFDLQGHGTMDSIRIAAGEKITKPEDPTAADYIFTGWFKEVKCKNKWDFDMDTVNSDIILYAGWEQAAPPVVTYIVSFDLKSHGTMDSISVTAGNKINRPADPSSEGYLFTGWYKDAAYTDKWDFDTDTVNSDITLYAGWEQTPPPVVTYTVSFDLQGHGTMDNISVAAGSTINQPADPSDPGYLFKGWYRETTYKTLWNFTTDIVTNDTTLYALWEIDESYDGVLSKDIPQQGIPEGLWAAQPEDFIYTGKAITPDIHVYYGNKRLDAGTDYTLSYKNNTNAGTITDTKAPSIIIKGKSVYAGKETVKFNILPADLSSHEVISENMDIVYNGKKQKKVPTLTYNGKKLTTKKDFTIFYEPDKDYTEPDDYKIILTAKANSNFINSKTVYMQIRKGISIHKTKIKLNKDKIYTTYTGNPLEPPLTVTAGKEILQKDIHYTIQYENNTEIGTASVIVTGIGDYAGTKKITFKITGTSLKKAAVTGIQNEEYTGLPHRPKITVTLDKTLEEGQDYKVTYLNNKNAGKASIIITGSNAYTGTVKKTFKIAAYSLNDDQGFLEGLDEELTAVYNKKGSKPELHLTFKGKPLVLGKDYTVTCKNNKGNGKKTPTATIKGKGNFKGKRTVPFTITEDAEQKSEMLYQVIEKGCKNQVGIKFDSSKNIVKAGDYIDISTFGLSNNSEEDKAFVYQTYRKVYYDHPEFFYLDEGIYRYGPNGPLLGIIPFYHDFVKAEADLEAYSRNLEKAVADAMERVKDVEDPIEQLLLLHDYIAENMVYNWEVAVENTDAAATYAWSAYGQLVEHDAVCKGIAMSYKLLVDRMKNPRIKCIVVPGKSPTSEHVWNIVTIDGQNSYHVDVNRSISDVPTLRGKATHTGFLLSDDKVKRMGYEQWVAYSPYDHIPMCDSTVYESGFIFNDLDFPAYRNNGSYYYLKRTGYRKYSLCRGENLKEGDVLAEIPLLTRDFDGAYYKISAGVVWRGNHLYYVDENCNLVSYNLEENANIMMEKIPFTYEPSPDDHYGEEDDGIGLYFDEQDQCIVAVSRTRRCELIRCGITRTART